MALDAAQLTAFAAVVEEGSFDAAARRLHITPSAISQRIKALESRMGQVLVRRSRPSRPTEAGQVLVRLAGQVALLEREALSEVTGEATGEVAGAGSGVAAGSGGPASAVRLSIAVNADSLATWFLPALTAVPADQRVLFDIHQEDQDHSVALLRDGSVMAAVTAEPQAVQGCRVEELGAMRYLAVASVGYRDRFLGGALVPDALEAAPMLVFNRKDGLQQRFLHMLTRRRLDPPVTYLPSSWGFVEAARLGLGWGMVPEQMARPYLGAGELVELRPGCPLDVPLYWQRWRLESTTLAILTEAVRVRCAGDLIQGPGGAGERASSPPARGR